MARKPEQAHKILLSDGRLAGVRTPYSQEFISQAQAEGYVWRGKRWGNYWRVDERLLVTGQLSTDELWAAFRKKEEQLVSLAAEYFEMGPDMLLETAVSQGEGERL